MISEEDDEKPVSFDFDVAVVAVGYERRCRWITNEYNVSAKRSLGLEFGFLKEAAYSENRIFFEEKSFTILNGIEDSAPNKVFEAIKSISSGSEVVRVFLDVSSMSREMIANVAMAIQSARYATTVEVTVAYAPSRFPGKYTAAPIRRASPILPSLAGWSSQPEQPLGAVFGLGCEPDLALGALQVLEPNKAWVFMPRGNDAEYDREMLRANRHLSDIFDVTDFNYEIVAPTITRGKLEALLNAVESDFRIIVVPFGPKIFAWLSIATVVFTSRSSIGVWAFSSKDRAVPFDHEADGSVIWHSMTLPKKAN